MPREVFISYCSDDEIAANEVRAALESRGIACWIAPRDIPGGQSWASSIVGALEECLILLVIISGHANRSRQMAREVELADSKRRHILPVRVENVEPQKDLEYFISNRQWIDVFPPPIGSHADALYQAVVALRDADTTHSSLRIADVMPAAEPIRPAPLMSQPILSPASRMRWLLAALVVATVVLSVALVMMWSKSRGIYKEFLNDATEYASNGRWLESIDSYDMALATNPPTAVQGSIYYGRCHAKMQAQMFDDALDDCAAAVRLDPNSVSARIDMGQAHLRLKQPTDAIGNFEEALTVAKKIGDLPGQRSAASWIEEAKRQAIIKK